jgi:hypothetical protein
MHFPATRAQLQEAGYKFEFARPCRKCGMNLEFYRTPANALAPMEGVVVNKVWLMDSHFKTCPFRDEFKKTAAKPASRPGGPAKIEQGDLFGESK